MEIIIVIIAFVATVIGSISGIGGGVVIKPFMDAITGLPAGTINFMSGNTVLAMTIVSLIRSRKDSVKPEPKMAIFLSLGAVVGGILGKTLFQMVKELTGNNAGVSFVQNVIMVFLTVAVFVYIQNKAKIKTHSITNPVVTIIVGFVLGIISAFLGIGGGPINIMVLSFCFSLDSKKAAITSLCIIFFSQVSNLVTNIVTNAIPEFNMIMMCCMIVAAVIGATVGRMLNKKISNTQVDKLFQGLMIVIILLSIFNAVKFGLAM